MAKDLTERLAQLTEAAVGSTSRKDDSLPDSPSPAPIPPRTGAASPKTASGNGSVAGPFTEISYADRTFYGERAVTSTDGIFVMMTKPIKKMAFKDGNDSPVIFNFQEPV